MADNMKYELKINLYREIPKFRGLLNYDKVLEKIKQQDEIILLVDNLDWGLSQEEQGNAIKKLLEIVSEDDYDLLLIAGNKRTWHNAVQVIREAGYPKNKKALPSLVLLLQDLNWPGVNEGMVILKDAGKDTLIPILETAIEEGFSSNDYTWLAGIRHFLEFAEIKKHDFKNYDTYDLLKYSEW